MATRIVGLERRLMTVGRIRLGHLVEIKGGKKRPEVLEKPRLTSSTPTLLHQAAGFYGGTVEPWTDAPPGPRQWELYIEKEELPILIPPLETLSQCYECWSASGLRRRCDNQTIQKAANPAEVGQPCQCPPDPDERQELAAKGEACQLTTRISCMLPELKTIGLWGLTTHSYYASLWTAGMVEMLETLAKQGRICEAALKIERQTRKDKQGRRKNFAIPTIMPTEMTPRLLFAPEMREALQLEAPTPRADERQKALPQHIEEMFGGTAGTPEVFDLIAQIEAAIAGQGGDVGQWEAWAVETVGKPRAAFTVEDYARWLQAVRTVEKRGPRPKEPPTPKTVTGEVLDVETGTNGPWRANVTTLAATLPDSVTPQHAPALVTQVHAACEQALRLAQDPQAAAPAGEAMLERLRTLRDEVSGQLRLGK